MAASAGCRRKNGDEPDTAAMPLKQVVHEIADDEIGLPEPLLTTRQDNTFVAPFHWMLMVPRRPMARLRSFVQPGERPALRSNRISK
jgi:hypothetical protein